MKKLIKTDRRVREIIYRGLITAVFICLMVSSVSYAGIVNSKHDLSALYGKGMQQQYNQYNEVCVYCHTPHSAGSQISAPLWNRQYPGGVPSFTLYSSTTLDTTPGQPQGISLACLSCHDGTIAVDEIINPPGNGWTSALFHRRMSPVTVGNTCTVCHQGTIATDHRASYLTTDLSNDHPVSIDYNDLTSQFGIEFVAPTDTLKGWSDVKLYGGYVECASCHDVHNPNIAPFLRMSNSNSALCMRCHIK